jgi:hypothetical protein
MHQGRRPRSEDFHFGFTFIISTLHKHCWVQETVLSTLSEWLGDPACNRNPTVLLISGIIYAQEGMYEDALKACHVGPNLEL